MWKLVLVFCLFACGAVAAPRMILVGDRSYLIDLPGKPSGAFIVALHNASGNPEEFRLKSGLSGPALAQGYAVIYPAGSGFSWNGFYCCGPAQANRVADVKFLDMVIADAAKRFDLDPARVYLTGMGNGSVMAETYAARRAGRVKAVAGVAGTIDLRRTPATAIPLLHIHGNADTVVPYGLRGPELGSDHRTDPFTPVAVEIAAFVAANRNLRKTSRVIDGANDGTSVTEDTYSDASGIPQVRLLTVKSGKHVWPARERKGPGNTQDIVATTEILRFFGEHP